MCSFQKLHRQVTTVECVRVYLSCTPSVHLFLTTYSQSWSCSVLKWGILCEVQSLTFPETLLSCYSLGSWQSLYHTHTHHTSSELTYSGMRVGQFTRGQCFVQVQLSLSQHCKQLHLICFTLCAAEALSAAVSTLWTINLESTARPEL